MADAYLAALEHVRSLLIGDTAFNAAVGGRIFEDAVPQNAPSARVQYPLVIIQEYTSRDVQGLSTRTQTQIELAVVVVAESKSYTTTRVIAGMLDDLLQNSGPRTTAYGHVSGCRRLRPLPRTSSAEGRLFKELGGVYRINVS